MIQRQCKLSASAITMYGQQPVKRLKDVSSRVLFCYHANKLNGSFYFVKKIAGHNVWRKLGTYPNLSVPQARALAQELEQTLSRQKARGDGVSISTHIGKRARTVNDLMRWYQGLKNSDLQLAKNTKSNINSIINSHLRPRLGHLSLAHLQRNDVRALLVGPLLSTLRLGSVQKILQVLKQACQLGYRAGVITSPVLQDVSLRDFTHSRVRARLSRLSPTDLPKVIEHIVSAPFIVQQVMAMMLMHGTRLGETVMMQWQDVDGEKGLWRLPAARTKTRKTLLLPLTDVAQECHYTFSLMRKVQQDKSPWVFPRYGLKHLHIDSNNVGKQIKAAGNGRYTSHDLRKLMRTGLMELGVDHFIGEQLLNHRSSYLDEAYIHSHVMEQKLLALQKWHELLLTEGLQELLKSRREFVNQNAEWAIAAGHGAF